MEVLRFVPLQIKSVYLTVSWNSMKQLDWSISADSFTSTLLNWNPQEFIMKETWTWDIIQTTCWTWWMNLQIKSVPIISSLQKQQMINRTRIQSWLKWKKLSKSTLKDTDQILKKKEEITLTEQQDKSNKLLNSIKDSFKLSSFQTNQNLKHTTRKWSNSAKYWKSAADIKSIRNSTQTKNLNNRQNKKRRKELYLPRNMKTFNKTMWTTSNN